jgi:hypothetical protein
MSLTWKIILPIALALVYFRDYLYPKDQDFVYFFDWISQLEFIVGFGFRVSYDYFSFFIWTILLALVQAKVYLVFYNLREVPISFMSFLKKRFVGIYLVNLIPCILLFLLPWYAALISLLIFPFFQLILPTVIFEGDSLPKKIKKGFRYSSSSFVENENRGPSIFPDVLDLIAGFVEKITASYALNGAFWANIVRQTVYILALLLFLPLYSILSYFLFSNVQEVKTARGLTLEFDKFGKRNRFKETDVED